MKDRINNLKKFFMIINIIKKMQTFNKNNQKLCKINKKFQIKKLFTNLLKNKM